MMHGDEQKKMMKKKQIKKIKITDTNNQKEVCEVSKMKRMKIMDMDNDGYEEIIEFIDKNNGYAGL